jgi:hypothetical protein
MGRNAASSAAGLALAGRETDAANMSTAAMATAIPASQAPRMVPLGGGVVGGVLGNWMTCMCGTSAAHSVPGALARLAVAEARAYPAAMVDNASNIKPEWYHDGQPVIPSEIHTTNEVSRELGWTDVAVSAIEGAGALTQDDFPENGSPFQALFMANNADDEISFVAQLPHSWRPTTPVRPHLHIVPCADPLASQVARFQIRYAWSSVNAAIPPLSEWATATVDVTIDPGGALKQRIVSFEPIQPPAGVHESALFMWSVSRLGAQPEDTYSTNKAWGNGAANVAVLSVDVHYQTEKSGTEIEFPGA